MSGTPSKNDRERGDFHSGIPTIKIGGRIGFGDSHLLRAANGVVERAAFFDFGEHDVGGGVEHAGETAQIGGGQAEREKRKNRDAVHHGGFVEKAAIFFFGERGEFGERVDDGTFVGGDGVRAEFERGFDVIGGGFAGGGVERTGFEDDVGASAFDPFANVVRSGGGIRRRPVIIENGERIEAVGIGDPAVAARGDAGEAPADVVAAAEFGFFGDEQAQEGARDVAEADDGEVVGGHD